MHAITERNMFLRERVELPPSLRIVTDSFHGSSMPLTKQMLTSHNAAQVSSQ
jgi:hypothetical protein